ncbi:MAG: hypothetical protein NTW78_03945 [Campylobacterales bacterium]|nr:hypothetical protein [Campylobacterales bacterium]
MIRFLDGLVLIKEIEELRDLSYTVSELKKMYHDKIVIIRHTAYIYRECLCNIAQKNTTVLDDYIQVGELADRMSINKSNIRDRIDIMKKNPHSKLFDFLEIGDVQFIKIDNEFKFLLQNYQPFYAGLKSISNPEIRVKLLGDLIVGFY